MDEQEKTIGDKWVEVYDDLNDIVNAWHEFINSVSKAFEEFNEVVTEFFKTNQKHELQKRPKIVKCLGCRPKTKIFKGFKDHRNCKKYRR